MTGHRSWSLPTGDGAAIELDEIRGAGAGPVLTLIGGIHGDEPEGVLAVRRVVAAARTTVRTGTLRAVAVAHPAAFAADRRCSPLDGLNLARVFPGDGTGSPTRRIARRLTDDVITGADLLIDLHSAGRDLEMPLYCGYSDVDPPVSRRSAAAAQAFGCPVVWAHDHSASGRTLSAANDLGIPALYVESAGGGGIRGVDLDAYVTGVLRVLQWMGMTPGGTPPPRVQAVITGGHGDIDVASAAPADGLLVRRASAGDLVAAGTPLLEVFGDDGLPAGTVVAPQSGMVMLLRRRARVRAGEPVALVASPPGEPAAPRALEPWA